ncbi:hypothetical protein NUH16_004669 [Penicillium rubens]|nr:hypothetical protein NUH16_004669 [Penicillium rubens]
MTAAQNCSTCFLSTLQTELNSYFGYDEELAEDFSSLTSSCSKTNYPFTSPSVYTVVPSATASISVTSTLSSVSSSATTATADCAEHYTIQEGDTCYSISTKFNSSTHELLYRNSLPAYCAGFPSAGTALCIPEACDIYTVQEDDTCYSIMVAHDYAFTVTQLISWNPNINRECSNVNQLIGSQICISFEKGATPTVSLSAAITTAPVPTDLAGGTNTRCAEYHQVATNETCSLVTVKMGISLIDFYFLNPEVNSTSCNNLIPGESYCVKAVGDVNTYSGYEGISQTKCIFNGTIASSCLATTILPTDTYWEFPSAMNATSTPTSVPAYTTLPVASGTVSKCAQYEPYYDPGANRSNTVNTCDYIAYFVGITVDELLQLNPSLSYNSSNPSACSFQKGYRYCVRSLNGTASGTTSSPTSQSTTTISGTTSASTGIATPTPTQSGMVSNCNKFYDVVNDDGCYNIAAANSIALDDFYTWNPAVKTDCSGLQPDFYVCVGVTAMATTTATITTTTSAPTGLTTPTPTQSGMVSNCNNFYDVVKNDGCYDIAAANSIALDDFYKWNPAVKTDCSGLQPDVYVCVGVKATATTTTTTTTTTSASTGLATPTPTQSGMVSNCNSFYDVVKNDGCYDIAAANSIALNDFYKWNPAVKTDCSGLQPDFYVCVGLGA